MENTAEKKKLKSDLKNQWFLVVLVIVLAVAPLFLRKEAKFEGADDRAQKAISEVRKDYKPWFAPIWQPPSGEVETFIFALQAALGAGVIGYIFGYLRGKKSRGEN